MSTNNEPWVKTASDAYEDCIVGNRDGLISLKASIDEAISEKSASPTYKSDFISVVCTEDDWDTAEDSNLPKWQEFLFKTGVFIWLGLLPLLGIGLVISWFW
ncbi:hypothetical protein [Simiduia aestuariiviva]|uniref:Uncharacterized protein n=1 Tax=Simiduia aestuariiviva TaxID=1510459 RepID=A0A839UND6_9GAMM|nr:hypothetical protein [Simiduia aestuariiviva]MBB3166957.1 hypothetical protein [Simiduia aestuariiviva]